MDLKNIYDTIYKSFVGTSGLNFWDVFLVLFLSCLVALYIYLIYKYFSRVEYYSKDLNVAMAGVVIVTASIMLALQQNLVVSMGMVGALSIVRFRTAIKSPIDLLYLFWAISEGIICGVALYMLGFVLCIIMTVLLFVLERIPSNRTSSLLILKTNMDIKQDELTNKIKSNTKYSKNVSTIIRNNEYELIYEIEAKDQSSLIKELNLLSNINSINLVENKGNRRI